MNPFIMLLIDTIIIMIVIEGFNDYLLLFDKAIVVVHFVLAVVIIIVISVTLFTYKPSLAFFPFYRLYLPIAPVFISYLSSLSTI